ncbi:NAD(P)-binding domain protein [Niveomyces insectorum RCEF 264]|uniref:NAD(P)-binding domain protein n=1 Tax=Niveomyces insectorum RCEF 264 TaxID=1081102 RepID=A0A167YY17_9HYPO|nr:NAD(P)-binding domain protein [Niveomyces insectorum RCEF 264]
MPTPQLLVGKVAGITGGLTGIGRAIALEYLRHGAKVGINHLGGPADEVHVQSLLAEVAPIVAAAAAAAADADADADSPASDNSLERRLVLVPGDVAQPETGRALVARILAHFGADRLDVFVSNAGVCAFAPFLDLPAPLWEQTVATNLSGAFYATQAAGRQMALHQSPPGGSIIGISSISALVGGGTQTHYTPTKAGIKSLMQSCAIALGPYGIRCNSLLPGTIRTQLNEADLADDAKRAYMEGRTPLGRVGRPHDLAGPAVFLACEELSGYVTGAELLVDGGLYVNLQ